MNPRNWKFQWKINSAFGHKCFDVNFPVAVKLDVIPLFHRLVLRALVVSRDTKFFAFSEVKVSLVFAQDLLPEDMFSLRFRRRNQQIFAL